MSTFSFLTPFTVSNGFLAGVNTLDFRIQDFGAPTAFRVDDLAGSAELTGVSAVPAPGSWALMMAGVGLLAVLRRQRGAGLRRSA